MPDTQGPKTDKQSSMATPIGNEPKTPVEAWTSQLDSLLTELQELTQTEPVEPIVDRAIDNQLVQVRLGIASSLFTALRYKHAATAAHALRVALTSSAWCTRMNIDDEQRDKIEIAALLHDLGVIGIPDRILHKPGMLDLDEALIIERSRHMNVEILRASCAETDILSIVENVPAHYDGVRPGYDVSGEDIPLGSRIVAIVESFDSMTNEQVFRAAASEEAAIAELYACAGSQFDPELVGRFVEFCREDQAAARKETSRRWLQTLDPQAVEHYWRLHHAPVPGWQLDNKRVFETRLLDNMHDAVIFVDAHSNIQLWNSAAERMTGIMGRSVCHRQWLPQLLNLHDEKGESIEADDCPVDCAMHSGVQSLRRLVIWGRGGRPLPVDAHVIPVLDEEGKKLGVILALHDASSEISLEQRCQSLHAKATTDRLTDVANRAEFDRVQEMFIAAHLQRRLPCSLIICDLDHFKLVNDNYGHQAGDEVIKSFAGILKNFCHTGDMVARYGGEEFVMLCTDCDNATATRRADEVRYAFSRVRQECLDGRNATASFGVTEIQPGDTSETMFRRADRALLMAKGRGRNRVVQLGSGSRESTLTRSIGSPLSRVEDGRVSLEQDLLTVAPMAVAVEKLRGFVADHCARILEAEHNRARLQIEHSRSGQKRRRSDRVMSFIMDLELTDEMVSMNVAGGRNDTRRGENTFHRTRIHVVISPHSKRNRRTEDVLGRAREVMLSLRAYMMATEEDVPTESGAGNRGESAMGSASNEGLYGIRGEDSQTSEGGWFSWLFSRK